jgi:hypothetical protein
MEELVSYANTFRDEFALLLGIAMCLELRDYARAKTTEVVECEATDLGKRIRHEVHLELEECRGCCRPRVFAQVIIRGGRDFPECPSREPTHRKPRGTLKFRGRHPPTLARPEQTGRFQLPRAAYRSAIRKSSIPRLHRSTTTVPARKRLWQHD